MIASVLLMGSGAGAMQGDSEPTLQTLIGPAACASDADCRSVAVGHKACGGPAAYLAWSSRESDAQAVAAAAARSRVAPSTGRKGMSSDCALVTDPGARCQPILAAASTPSGLPGRCELRRGSGAVGHDVR